MGALKNLSGHPEFILGSLCLGHQQNPEILKQVQNDEITKFFKAPNKYNRKTG